MTEKSEFNNQEEQLIKKCKELINSGFPESPEDPFLDNLYLELSDYHVYVTNIANSILEGRPGIEKETIRIDEEWNERLDSFDPAKNARLEACSALKQHKQILDEFIDFVLKN